MLAQGQTMPSLTFEMLRVATGSGTILIKSEKAGIKSLAVKGFQLPTDGNGQLWVHYARNDPSLYVPAINVLERTVAPDKIAGKLVLIGTPRSVSTTSRPRRFRAPCRGGNPRPGAGKRVDRGGHRSRSTASRSSSPPRCCSAFW
jgi:CHASE2 domain.